MKKAQPYSIGACETISPNYEADFLAVGERVLGGKFIKYLEQGQHKTKFLSNSILEYLESYLIDEQDLEEFQKMVKQFSKIKDEMVKLGIILEYFVFGILSFESSNGDYYEFHIKKTNALMNQIEQLKKKINILKNKKDNN